MNDNQKTLLSFIVGAAAGVAAGMLLAPFSGADARRRILEKASTLREEVGTQLTDALSRFGNTSTGNTEDTFGNEGSNLGVNNGGKSNRSTSGTGSTTSPSTTQY